jgi:lysophospholipase L1-like esterase
MRARLLTVPLSTLLLAACSSSATPVESALSGAPAATTQQIVAFGDSFTAGFGFYADGTEMTGEEFFTCVGEGTIPADKKNDLCSSNGTARTAEDPLVFAPDYGYGNQISWAAQVAQGLGVPAESYVNIAISGSTGKEWAEDLFTIDGTNGLDAVAAQDPDVVLMTLGGNPTLGKVILGEGERCDAYDKPDQETELRACFNRIITEDGTYDALVTVYTRLLDSTDAQILVLTYPRVVPALALGNYTPAGLLIAREELNATIAKALDAVTSSHSEGSRLASADPEFAVGVPPGDYTAADCFGAAKDATGTDGPSNQSTPTQENFAEMYADTGWCPGTPYLIAGDSGVHPNKAGYAEFARVALAALGRN